MGWTQATGVRGCWMGEGFDEKGRGESRIRESREGGHKRSIHRASRGSREAVDGKGRWRRRRRE